MKRLLLLISVLCSGCGFIAGADVIEREHVAAADAQGVERLALRPELGVDALRVFQAPGSFRAVLRTREWIGPDDLPSSNGIDIQFVSRDGVLAPTIRGAGADINLESMNVRSPLGVPVFIDASANDVELEAMSGDVRVVGRSSLLALEQQGALRTETLGAQTVFSTGYVDLRAEEAIYLAGGSGGSAVSDGAIYVELTESLNEDLFISAGESVRVIIREQTPVTLLLSSGTGEIDVRVRSEIFQISGANQRQRVELFGGGPTVEVAATTFIDITDGIDFGR